MLVVPYSFMERTKDIIENLKAISKTDNVPMQSFAAEVQELLSTIKYLNKDTLNYVLNEIKDIIVDFSPIKAALFSIACGSIVEKGADPIIALDCLLRKVITILSLAEEFNKACYHAGVPNSSDPYSIIDSVRKKMPLEAKGYDTLDKIYPAVVTILSKSKKAR